MTKLYLILSIIFLSLNGLSQQQALRLKKGKRTIIQYWEGQFFSFQLDNGDWRKGELVNITGDSLYIRPMIVKYSLMGTDTSHFPVQGYSFADVYAVPKKGYLIDYIDGRFQINKGAGHVHWYWIKSGWIFRAAGAGYAGLNLINGFRNKDFTLRDSRLAVAGGVFLFGVLLHRVYKPVIRLNKKYRLNATG